MEGKCVSAASANDNNRSGWPEAILFDLDGTLIDSVPDIAAAVNELLRRGMAFKWSAWMRYGA
jgi:predicted secreted acid phosphatase